MQVLLKPFPYRYMEYEKKLMIRELETFFPSAVACFQNGMWVLENLAKHEIKKLEWLTFIGEYKVNGKWYKTFQNKIEEPEHHGPGRQHTRYSTHGVHEYKGKYNPQIVHFMLNLLGITKQSKVLDPFNGSGTTTLECAHLGIRAVGTDINPMACFIANSKLKTFSVDVETARDTVFKFINKFKSTTTSQLCNDERMEYLRKWIPTNNLNVLESIRLFALTQAPELSCLMLTVASDLIREYSYQEPQDLRIRRRKTPLPTLPLLEAFSTRVTTLLQKIQAARQTIGRNFSYKNYALCCDVKRDQPFKKNKFDAVITSPPYATALPYIDTQRISLVWLGLCEADQVHKLESCLIGSRETNSGEKDLLKKGFKVNDADLPRELYSLVCDMEKSVSEADGFRRRAVPYLFYRYLSDMKSVFVNVAKMAKDNAPFALIVGHNRTTLGGKTFYIDTPNLLSRLASGCGWRHEETIILETYKRYGLNQKNAIGNESMVILRKV